MQKFTQQFCESGLIKMNGDPNQISFTTQRFDIPDYVCLVTTLDTWLQFWYVGCEGYATGLCIFFIFFNKIGLASEIRHIKKLNWITLYNFVSNWEKLRRIFWTINVLHFCSADPNITHLQGLFCHPSQNFFH